MPVRDCVHVYMSCRSLANAEHASLRSIPDIRASSAGSAVREEARKMQWLASTRSADTNDASWSTWLDARQTTCGAVSVLKPSREILQGGIERHGVSAVG